MTTTVEKRHLEICRDVLKARLNGDVQVLSAVGELEELSDRRIQISRGAFGFEVPGSPIYRVETTFEVITTRLDEMDQGEMDLHGALVKEVRGVLLSSELNSLTSGTTEILNAEFRAALNAVSPESYRCDGADPTSYSGEQMETDEETITTMISLDLIVVAT